MHLASNINWFNVDQQQFRAFKELHKPKPRLIPFASTFTISYRLDTYWFSRLNVIEHKSTIKPKLSRPKKTQSWNPNSSILIKCNRRPGLIFRRKKNESLAHPFCWFETCVWVCAEITVVDVVCGRGWRKRYQKCLDGCCHWKCITG